MKTRTLLQHGIGISMHALALFLSATVWAQADVVSMTAASEGTVGTEQIQHMSAMVTAVDMKTRTVTLKREDGSELELTVSEEVKRLNEVKVGDQLNIGYLEAVSLDMREATAEELKEPLRITEQGDRAALSSSPAGAEMRTIRAVVTVEGLSRWLSAVTVRGPRGNYYVLEVQPDAVKWETLRIGQTMVATYTEALVMSIEPAVNAAK